MPFLALLSGPFGGLIKWAAGIMAVVALAGGIYLYGHHKGYEEASSSCDVASQKALVAAKDLQLQDLRNQLEAAKKTTAKVDTDRGTNQKKVDDASSKVKDQVKPTDTGINEKTIDLINGVRSTQHAQ